MSDYTLFTYINGLAGKVPAIDEFFKGVSNDYFSIITACLMMIWLWFATRDAARREQIQRAVIATAISVGFASAVVAIINHFYFRPRPFNVNSAYTVHLLFYRPTDSSFPSNLASVLFAFVIPVFLKNKKAGTFLLALAIISSFGRIYIGVHYPLDVAAGAAIGITAGFLALGASRLIKPLIDYILMLLQRICLA